MSLANCNSRKIEIKHVPIAVYLPNRLHTMLDDLIGHLIELIANIWSADTEMRNRSLLGESEDDRQSRRFVALLCGGSILVLICAAVGWWWLHR